MQVSFVLLGRGTDVDCLTINQMASQSSLDSAFAAFHVTAFVKYFTHTSGKD